MVLIILSASTSALAQATTCQQYGRTTYCNTTQDAQPNNQLQNSMAGFGSALGNAIAAKRAERAERKAQQQAREAQVAQAKNDNSANEAAVAAFAADARHPYFGLVRKDMAQLIANGRATTLDEAYAIAVASSPQVQLLEHSPQ